VKCDRMIHSLGIRSGTVLSNQNWSFVYRIFLTGNDLGKVSCVLEGAAVQSNCRREIPHPPRPFVGPTQPPVQRVPGLYPEVNSLGCGVDHPSPSSAKFKETLEIQIRSPMDNPDLWGEINLYLYRSLIVVIPRATEGNVQKGGHWEVFIIYQHRSLLRAK
jgi:hypothetical protein